MESNDVNASLKISDFGLASVTSEEEFMTTILGSKDFVGKYFLFFKTRKINL